jgi:lactoylglutathione lyase
MPDLFHTCYRVSDIDRSIAFYAELGFEVQRRTSADKDDVIVFMGQPGDGFPRLKLVYNQGVHSYDLGTGYSHIAVAVKNLDRVLEQVAPQGVHPEKAPFRPDGVAEGYSSCFVRDPDGYRIQLVGPTGGDPRPAASAKAPPEEAEEVSAPVAIDPPKHRVLPRNPDIGQAGVEDLWRKYPKYPMLRHDGRSSLLVRLPPEKGASKLLQGYNRLKVEYDKDSRHSKAPFSRLSELTTKLADHYGGVIVFRDSDGVEKCAPSCVKATSPVTECVCSCGGANHGTGALPAGFHVISESLAVRVADERKVTVTFIRPRSAEELERIADRQDAP